MASTELRDASEEDIINDFKQQTRGFWSLHSRYERVTVLLLSWMEDDLGVAAEIDRLQSLFDRDFHYHTERYEIPSENPGAELANRLTQFVKSHSLSERTLSIIYYGGHASNAGNEAAGYPSWRARLVGGPSTDWFGLQLHLVNAKGDVLVLLDCCHAATKSYRSFVNGQFEILAASSSGSRVPKPGRLSFTSILIRELRTQLNAGKDIPIRWLGNHLWNNMAQPALTESPQYFTLASHDLPTIRLAPLYAPLPTEFARVNQLPSSFALLSVSFTENPTARQIADWLKSYPPNIVREVNIEGLILKAQLIKGLNDKGELFKGSVLGGLTKSTQNEILDRVLALSHAWKTSEVLAQKLRAADSTSTTQITEHLQAETLDNLRTKLTDVSESIEHGLLLDPNVDLLTARKDQVVAAFEVEKIISLRQRLLSTSSIADSLDLPRRQITWSSHPRRIKGGGLSRLRTGMFQNHSIVAEVLRYDVLSTDTTSDGLPPSVLQQFRKMVAQLCHPKDVNFHILPGLGYVHERSSKTLSLIFELSVVSGEVSAQAISFTSLSEDMARRKRVALGDRIQLAASLAQALESFHKVGWVHKSLRSENIVFFSSRKISEDDKLSAVDPTHPWLFGFEYSRPEDADTALQSDFSVDSNAYRHPERWGKPLVKFEKYHDVYSLGIILSELAYWKPVKEFPEMKQKQIDPEKVKIALIERIVQDGPHVCGQSFTDCIVSCLRFKEMIEGMPAFEAHKIFKSAIVGCLSSINGV
ncbi:hypothetical protein BDV96DRAFT_689587 [Lophiotrema nucula]|uniref:Protein kinase domain-containing protein n=1 Tax=Lophiotrema nucula TaxID=690887 RepID=A0A6A5YZP3_9PLEO|nr:hypothetical protein BDV96DRAFT_689587 [Lophiotrema nucula]